MSLVDGGEPILDVHPISLYIPVGWHMMSLMLRNTLQNMFEVDVFSIPEL
jgi:hypothetical protein